MTTGSIEDQTRVVLDAITETLAEADFPGFNAVYAEYSPPIRRPGPPWSVSIG